MAVIVSVPAYDSASNEIATLPASATATGTTASTRAPANVMARSGPRTWLNSVCRRRWWFMYHRYPPRAASARNAGPRSAIGGGPVASGRRARTSAATRPIRASGSPTAGTVTSSGLVWLPNADASVVRRPATGTATVKASTVSPRPSRT